MADVEEHPRLSGEDWLDLNDGQKGIVAGRLDGALKRGQRHVMVAAADWSTMVVDIAEGYGGADMAAGTRLSIVATRTEDGLETTTDEIHIEEIA